MTTTLREQVAEVIRDELGEHGFQFYVFGDLVDAADAAIGVVLVAVAEQIEALTYWQSGLCGQQVETYRSTVLAVVARLGEDET
jgi:hypothetical protein